MSTPAKYVAKPRPYEQKATLRELYWGDEFHSAREIAEQFGVSKNVIRDAMADNGIPMRDMRYTRTNAVSPFTGFYDNECAPTDAASLETAQPDDVPDLGMALDWRKPSTGGEN